MPHELISPGQWIGRYTGDDSGYVVLNLDNDGRIDRRVGQLTLYPENNMPWLTARAVAVVNSGTGILEIGTTNIVACGFLGIALRLDEFPGDHIKPSSIFLCLTKDQNVFDWSAQEATKN